jgi:Ni/Co efflux regulator RcnB
MSMKRLLVVVWISVLAAFSPPVATASDAGISVTFSDDEIRIISAWYDDRESQKRGKAKRGGLPPGIARNLARGKSLPPGIAKQYLPQELQRALPAAPAGYDRIIVDGKILLVEVATQVIHDVLMDVLLD